jgi:enterochelin esterase-like enzyme
MKLFLCMVMFFSMAKSVAQLPAVSYGTINRIENLQSKFVSSRNIDVWLPEGYTTKKKYSVLYMHDGQMLFDGDITWNRVAWNVDNMASKLMEEDKIKTVIVVGIWNSDSTRHHDYFPQKPYQSLNQQEKDSVTAHLQRAGRTTAYFNPVSDNYLKFLVTELKPLIDKTYSTYTDRKNTFIAGSSMGGLISLYAVCEYPYIFGGAACLSTHWTGIYVVEGNPVPDAVFKYLSTHLPDPVNHKIYFDHGDQTLDALYPPLQKKADAIMKAKGFTEKNWITRYFPGENHSEQAWEKRLNLPLLFLLKK